MQLWGTPIRILTFYLIMMAVIASAGWARLELGVWLQLVRNFFLLYSSGWGMYQLIVRIKQVGPTRWEHRLITTLILFLLFDTFTPWWIFPLIGMTTELIQRFIRVPTGPVLNPAATAAVIFSFATYYPSWWGVNFGPRVSLLSNDMSLAFLFTVTVAGYVAYKYRKLHSTLTATILFAVSYGFFFRSTPMFIVLDGTLAFFFLVMLVEPKTSPILKKHQWCYGAGVGFLTAFALWRAWPEPYAGALLVGNIAFALYRHHFFLGSKIRAIYT